MIVNVGAVSLYSIVIGTGGHSDNVANDVVVKMNIYNLFAEIVLDDFC